MSFKQTKPNPPVIAHRNDVLAPIYWKAKPVHPYHNNQMLKLSVLFLRDIRPSVAADVAEL